VRYIRFDPGELTPEQRVEWDAWVKSAEQAAQNVCDAHAAGVDPIPFDGQVWRRLKKWLFDNVFHGRCAYCEGDARSVSFGDGEHWRPKGRVTDKDGTPAVDPESGEEHPGYFWLAYEWHNLLPACQQCNSGEADYKGKGTQFPIGGTRVFEPRHGMTYDELNDLEQPILLHPFYDDPTEHIEFDEFGQAIGKSDRGECSIQVYNLNRPDVDPLRRELREEMRKEVKHALVEQLAGGSLATETLRARMKANKRYSLATTVYIRYWYPIVLAQISEPP
jgi:hypothetical protein